ncbi:MAG TPA: hypothetical protein VKT82_25420 [Ktedonobacterales bacterium]|nr:hypothetical protein [Ktedonobacterales bacterium]
MDQEMPGSTNQIISADAEHGSGTREGTVTRCAICRKRIWVGALTLQDPEEAPEPHQSWMLCKICYAAVQTELGRSPLRSPLRVRVAVGLVAAERWPRAARSDGEREDRVWIAFLYWGFAGAMLLHLLIIVLLAQIAR